MITLIAFIFVFSILVFFHELGHFLSAKAFGVKVYKFAFGFGPKLIGFTRNETEYNICLIPLGGYVKMAGEMGENDENIKLINIPEKERFDKKPISIRAIIVALGPMMNIITAIIIFTIIFLINGIPMTSSIIDSINEGGPADEAGLEIGDEIIKINNLEMDNTEQIANIISKNTDNELMITVDRSGDIINLTLLPEYNEEYQRGMIGISFKMIVKKMNLFTALNEGIKTCRYIIRLIFTNTIEMVSGKIPLEVAGPLGIAQMTGEFAKLGFMSLIYFTAVLSIFIGVFNLIPIPILDGGQIILLFVEKIRGKPMESEKMNFIYLIGISLMIVIFIFATYKDISRIFFE